MRKGQAALEFLTTYGWAFIVILVMIGALAYFGVLNPSKVLPNKCIVEAGFSCKEYQILNNQVDIILANGKGSGFTIKRVNATSDAGDISGTCTPAVDIVVPVDSEFTISCDGAAFTDSVGEKIKVNFEIDYIMAKGTYTQTFRGEVYTEVQP